jgi:acyl-CoA thioesterase
MICKAAGARLREAPAAPLKGLDMDHAFTFPLYKTDAKGRVFMAQELEVCVTLDTEDNSGWFILDVKVEGRESGKRKDDWFALADDDPMRAEIIDHALTYESDELEEVFAAHLLEHDYPAYRRAYSDDEHRTY